MKKYNRLKFCLSFSLVICLLMTNAAFARDFSDVDEDDSAKVAIDYLVDEGCVGGYEDGTFKPDNSVSRVESLKIILACLKLDKLSQEGEFVLNTGDVINIGDDRMTVDADGTKVNYIKNIKFPAPAEDEMLEFSDIDYDAWYIPFLQEAVHRDLIKGYKDKTIKPHQEVSLAELLTILSRAARAKKPDMTIDLDLLPSYLDDDSWYGIGVAFGLQEKLIGIEEGKRLDPFYPLDRGEAVIIVYNYLVLSQQKKDEPVEEDSSSEDSVTEDETEKTEVTSNASGANDEFVGFTETGVASYYSYGVDGVGTASGEKLDVNAFQAAHLTLPFNTIIKVTNVETDRWVKARVIDRGPHVDGRVVDLTPSAFEAIGDLSAGLVNVRIEVDTLP